ncbi:MAG: hypothetical protein LBV80_09555 [Deltaproteobacteria bacterium]|nr:hypothetical protein [Deltaproteobacteria bacterium]
MNKFSMLCLSLALLLSLNACSVVNGISRAVSSARTDMESSSKTIDALGQTYEDNNAQEKDSAEQAAEPE